MDTIKEDNFTTSHIGHLGLVADKIHDLGLIDLIDERLPIKKGCGSKVTHGERVAAMIMNGLGFVDNRLYLFPSFLSKKPVSRLFQKPLEASWFNDDALGRCLDEIAAYGTTKLFTEIAFIIGKQQGLLGNSYHLDTTTLSLYGEYGEEVGTNPHPKRGYAKSGRHDLKQMVLLLATTGASHFPISMEAHSGDMSDKKSLLSAKTRLQTLCQGLKGSEAFIYVADSAIYGQLLCESPGHWITRVPETLKAAKTLVSVPEDGVDWSETEGGYRWHEQTLTIQGVRQRWILYFSQAAYDREVKTLNRRIEKAQVEQTKAWWHLSCQTFACEADAEKAIKAQKKTLRYHEVETQLEAVIKQAGRGRPKKGASGRIVGYRIRYTLLRSEAKIAKARQKKGRFILGTDLTGDQLSASEVLKEYKAQSGVEKSFKFIKNKTFEVDAVFLCIHDMLRTDTITLG